MLMRVVAMTVVVMFSFRVRDEGGKGGPSVLFAGPRLWGLCVLLFDPGSASL